LNLIKPVKDLYINYGPDLAFPSRENLLSRTLAESAERFDLVERFEPAELVNRDYLAELIKQAEPVGTPIILPGCSSHTDTLWFISHFLLTLNDSLAKKKLRSDRRT
jgi:hypothetical protein